MKISRLACVHSGSAKATQSFAELAGYYDFLPHTAKVYLENLDPGKRPLAATADFMKVFGVLSIDIGEDDKNSAILLFDPEHSLEERVIAEQFAL
jgi:hypothetical protein